jgi:hypothetical protein
MGLHSCEYKISFIDDSLLSSPCISDMLVVSSIPMGGFVKGDERIEQSVEFLASKRLLRAAREKRAELHLL